MLKGVAYFGYSEINSFIVNYNPINIKVKKYQDSLS